MYFPNEEMKINKFKLVFIPSNSAYMNRIGMKEPPMEAYSGDAEIHRPQNKVDDIDFYMRYASMKSEEAAKSENKDD